MLIRNMPFFWNYQFNYAANPVASFFEDQAGQLQEIHIITDDEDLVLSNAARQEKQGPAIQEKEK